MLLGVGGGAPACCRAHSQCTLVILVLSLPRAGARQVLQVVNAPISNGVNTGAGTAFNNFAPTTAGGSGGAGANSGNSGNVTRTTTAAASPSETPAAEAPPARSQGLITGGDLGASNFYFTPGNANNCVGRGCSGRRLD